MTDQEILDNAPEGATHWDGAEYEYLNAENYSYWGETRRKWVFLSDLTLEPDTRSLADIKRIAELEDLAQMIIDAESADPRVISLMYNAWLHKAKSLKEQE